MKILSPVVADQGSAGRSSARMLERAFEIAKAQIAREDRLPCRDLSPAELERKLGIALSAEGSTFDEVASKLAVILAETPSAAGRRFFNQLFGGRDEIASLAEMLTPLVNTSMYTYKVAGPQVLVEREVITRMLAKAGFHEGEGILCPGGSLATLTAMLIARNQAYQRVRQDGFQGNEARAAIYTSADGHYSIRKNAGILGLGREAVREIPTDSAGHMDVDKLRRAVARDRNEGRRPLMINATAGTTVLGVFDPVLEIGQVARDEGIWLHVDGALGGSVLLATAHRHLLNGLESADSFVWNAHKMMGVPLPCSALLLARRGLLAGQLSESADYLFQDDPDELNPGTRSIQCGRRNDGLKLWAAWKLHGDRGFDRRLSRLFELASYTADAIGPIAEFDLIAQPESINVCFEVKGKSCAEICARASREGKLLVGHGRAGNRQAIRLVCVNPDLSERDIDWALEQLRDVAAAVPAREPEGEEVAVSKR